MKKEDPYPVLISNNSYLFRKGLSFKILFFISVLLPILIFFLVWINAAVNIPYQDDIDAMLVSTTHWAQGFDSIGDFWAAIWEQDDERRIVIVRLVACLVYSLNGILDLRFVALAGILTYPLFLFLIYKWFKKEKSIPLFLFLPIPFFLFTQTNFDAIYWSMIPLQHIGVYIWGFLALWFLSKESPNYIPLALCSALISICSDVTGTLILYAGVLLIILQGKYIRLIPWGLVVGTMVFLYFHGLVVPSFRPSFRDNIQEWPNMIGIVIAMPGMMADIFTNLSNHYRITISILAGLVSIILVCYYFFFHLRLHRLHSRKEMRSPNDLWLVSCILFLSFTFAVFAMGRAAQGMESILISRYKHMYIFWGIFNYLLLLKIIPFPFFYFWIGRFLLPFSIFLFGFNYFTTWEKIDFYRKTLIADAHGWQYNRTIPSTPIYISLRTQVDQVLTEAINNKVFKFPSVPFATISNLPVKGSTDISLSDDDVFITISIHHIQRGERLDDGLYAIFESDNEVHILPMENPRKSLFSFIKSGHYYQENAKTEPFVKKYLKSGKSYKIKIGVIDGKENYILSTKKIIQT